MTFVDAINAARDALDEYTRDRSDSNLLRFIAACDELKTHHDGGALQRALARRESALRRTPSQ